MYTISHLFSSPDVPRVSVSSPPLSTITTNPCVPLFSAGLRKKKPLDALFLLPGRAGNVGFLFPIRLILCVGRPSDAPH